jgi:hypothetical protein
MSKNKPTSNFVFKKDNYMWLLISIAFIVVGFLLMSGGGSDDPNVFSESIFSDRRITIAPIMVLIGFGIAFYSIMKKPKE